MAKEIAKPLIKGTITQLPDTPGFIQIDFSHHRQCACEDCQAHKIKQRQHEQKQKKAAKRIQESQKRETRKRKLRY
jgi:hypothetical protein